MSFVDQVRSDLELAIARAIKESSYADSAKNTRHRIATREDIIRAMIFMEGGSLDKELHKAGLHMTASAFIQRRDQLHPELFQVILGNFEAMYPDTLTYKGYHIYAVDGTAINIKRDPSADSFVIHPGAPQGYNQLHVTPLYNVMSKRYYPDFTFIQPEPQKDEIHALMFNLHWHRLDFPQKTLILGDRLYGTYNVFATFKEVNVDFLIRVKQGKGAMRPVAQLLNKESSERELDEEVDFTIVTSQKNEFKQRNDCVYIQESGHTNKKGVVLNKHRWDYSSPYPMRLRIVHVRLENGTYETLATSLPDSFTLSDIRALYSARWGVELAFRELKYHLGLNYTHSVSEYAAYSQVYCSTLAGNICSRIINEVIARQPEGSPYEYAINRKMAVYLIKEYFRTPGADGDELMRNIARYVVPIRPGRTNERSLRAKGFVSFTYRVSA